MEWIMLVGFPTGPHTWEATLQNVGTGMQGKYLLPMDDSLSRAAREEKSGKYAVSSSQLNTR